MNVDDTFSSKEDVAHAVRDRLSVLMAEYGYEIIAVLVVDIEPDKQVKEAMNEINGKCSIDLLLNSIDFNKPSSSFDQPPSD